MTAAISGYAFEGGHSMPTTPTLAKAVPSRLLQSITTKTGGILRRHTHPRSPNEPDHLPKVRTPIQKNTPPLIQWANPLKISCPSYV